MPTRVLRGAGIFVGTLSLALLFGCPGDGVGRLSFDATLSGANEVPPVATAAFGTMQTTLDDRQLEINGIFYNLESDLLDVSGSPAHLHEAPAGVSGPIVFNVEVSSTDRRNGTFTFSRTLTEAEDSTFRAGRYYLNIHTVAHPDGEIRVQLSEGQPERETFSVDLAGSKEVPPVATNGSGTVLVELVGDMLVLTGNFQGLGSELIAVSGSPAHVHQAPEGQNGPIVFPVEVTPGVDARSGTFRMATLLNAPQRQAFDDGELYINVHTVGAPNGEIRAQLRQTPGL